jgi:hypothetical protein
MITFIKNLFARKSATAPEIEAVPEQPKSRYSGYDVEFYPNNGVYYARYKGKYLKTGFGTGIIEEGTGWSGFTYAQRFHEEKAAWRLIDLHIEQRTKENVKVLTRND